MFINIFIKKLVNVNLWRPSVRCAARARDFCSSNPRSHDVRVSHARESSGLCHSDLFAEQNLLADSGLKTQILQIRGLGSAMLGPWVLTLYNCSNMDGPEGRP